MVRGTGSIGARHLRVLRALGVQDLVAVPVRPGRASSPELGDARIAAELPQEADVVVVATDTARHVDDAIQALDADAGVVLVEKPLCADAADAAPLLAHPRRDRVRVSAPLRFHEGLRDARAAVTALPGGPVAARVVAQSWLPGWRPERDYRDSYSARPGEGGVLRDLVHEIDYALWTFGRPVALEGHASDVPSPVLGLAVDESADLSWRTAEGADVSIRIDYVTRPARRSMLVTSPDGSVLWDVLGARVETVGADGSVASTEYPQDHDRDVILSRQTQALLALGAGQGDDLLDLETALLAVRIGERVRESTGQRRTEFA
ncbi:Gfo/Idh/MocA family oxidoreductase [Cellulosimicrobium cellulans]|uniref:Gfo/Idh/MocA family protein n=1 Tax=Cellulosimicrobium cellulans TaxID=1710 RepID=UPI0021B11A79|nr:Gfo/Idh/MocA family oxidoreductase [Cellulosimicrobium cellulans]